MNRFRHNLLGLIYAINRYPRLVLTCIVFLTFFLVINAKNIQFDSSLESFLAETNTSRQAYLDFKSQYGQSEYFIVVIPSNTIFSKKFKQSVQALEQAIYAQVPYVRHVESLVSAQHIRLVDEAIEIGQLFDHIDKPDDVMSVALRQPFYVNRLVNHEGNITALIVQLKGLIEKPGYVDRQPLHLAETEQALIALRQVIKRFSTQFEHPLQLSGSPLATVELTEQTRKDIINFSLMAIFIVCFALWLFFKRFSAVVLPIFSLMVAIALTMSLLIIGRFPLQMTSAILPSFLMAVCVGDAVHFLKAFYHAFDRGLDKNEAIDKALAQTASAMFFTTVMTAIGLLSFAHSDIVPIASFGGFAALGVSLALILTLFLLPSTLRLVAIKKRQPVINSQIANGLKRYVHAIQRYAFWIVTSALLLLVFCFYCAYQLSLSHDALQWLKADNPVRTSIHYVDENLTGTMQLELLINAHGEPISAQQFQQINQWLNKLKVQSNQVPITSLTSILDLLKETHALLVDDQSLLPKEADLLAQELLLIELNSPDEFARWCRDQCTEMRVMLSTPWQDAVYYTDFINLIEQQFNQEFKQSMQLTTTGMASIVNQTFQAMLNSMLLSYIIAASLISILLMLFVRQFGLGIALMLPNLLPIFAVLAIMFWLEMPLDLFSLLMGSIAIGIIVDDSVHFISSVNHFLSKGLSVEEAVESTLQQTGVALLVTTLVLSAGFLSYSYSDLQNLVNFGWLTAACVCFALLADFIIAPAILFLVYKKASTPAFNVQYNQ